ncbi:unnamed protein product [Symbiodinium natans]|uniref:Uncharacterized protein n=1 Tax=Symbiodinium natans TaxID=878477 RepID=A0A812SN50_9DINO|nr:unnamed protein product [Symbiodinium natans]
MRLLLVALVGGACSQEVKKPIVTTDLIHGTGELLYDMYTAAYHRFLAHHVDKHSKSVREALEPMMPQDPVGDLCQKVGVEKQEIFRRVDSAAELASNARETAQVHGSKVHLVLSQVTHAVIDGFERLLPAHKGIISRTPGDLLLFCLWVVTVLYITLQIALVAFRISWRVFLFGLKLMCCCGCLAPIRLSACVGAW